MEVRLDGSVGAIDLPPISNEMVAKWQTIVDLVAEIVRVPSGVITRVTDRESEIVVASSQAANPFKRGDRGLRNPAAYCETAIGSLSPLRVSDALADPAWCTNPDVPLGLVAYLGLPLQWPDGRVFGTLCVLDNKPNEFSALYLRLLEGFKKSIEADLAFLVQAEEALQARQSLLSANAKLQELLAVHEQQQYALQRSEERLRGYFETSVVGAGIVSLCKEWVEVNGALCGMLGYEPGELIGQSWSAIVHPDDLPRCIAFFEKMATGEPAAADFEKRFVRKDGRFIVARMAVRAVRDAQGRVDSFSLLFEDITARKEAEAELEAHREHLEALVTERTAELAQANVRLRGEVEQRAQAEEALRQRDELFRAAQELSPDGFFVMHALRDSEGVIEDFVCDYANPAALRFLDRPNFVGQRYTHAFPSVKTHSNLFARYVYVIETGKPSYDELRYEADGIAGWFRNTAIRLEDGVAVSFSDITERKQAEQERVRLATAVEQAAEAIVITDAQGLIQYVNPAFERITGYRREEVLAQNPHILKSGKQEPEFYQHMWETVLSGQVWRGQLVNRRKDGSHFVGQVSITPLRAEGSEITHFVAIVEDVSERQQLEAQFRQAQKLEAVGRLAGGVAHDFNNLLTAILGSADLLVAQLHPNDPLHDEVSEIRRAGERAASLTRQLLAFSRRQVLQPRVIDLNEVVAGMEKMLRRLIGEDIRLESRLAPDLHALRADPGQLEQILLNLVVNARDAMPSGGRLTLDTRNVWVAAPVRMEDGETLVPGNYVELAVSDTGSGIADELLPHIFEPFFTTKEEGKGTGLGLSTVYGIARQSGGWVTFNNLSTGGAVFRVLLPAAEGAGESLVTSRSVSTPENGNETILVAEDEDVVRSLVCRVLRYQGYTVLEARNGGEAMAVLRGHAGPIHLMVSDVIMPGMYGPELAAQAIRHSPELRVIFMTGHADRFLAEVGSVDGAAPILPKPFTPDQLTSLVRQVLREPPR